MFTLDANCIDKSLPVPVGTQLHGLLSYMLAFGGYSYGDRLPSIRQLAADIGVAPMTVAQVYRQLRDDGLIETHQGQGAFVIVPAASANVAPSNVSLLRDDIDRLLGRASELGVSTMSLISMLNAQAMMRDVRRRLSVVFVCIFEEAGRDYVRQIQPCMEAGEEITLVTFDQISQPGPELDACRAADLVLTFVHREADARRLIGSDKVLGLRFIPSQQTRQNLASLEPQTPVLGVTHLKDYIAIMRPTIREFAPHLAEINVTWSSAENLAEEIDRSGAVIFATGADRIAALVAPGVTCFEFRHAPDPGFLRSVLVPRLAQLRQEDIRAA